MTRKAQKQKADESTGPDRDRLTAGKRKAVSQKVRRIAKQLEQEEQKLNRVAFCLKVGNIEDAINDVCEHYEQMYKYDRDCHVEALKKRLLSDKNKVRLIGLNVPAGQIDGVMLLISPMIEIAFDAGVEFSNAARRSQKPHIPAEEPPLNATKKRLASLEERALWGGWYRELWRRSDCQYETIAQLRHKIHQDQGYLLDPRTIANELKRQGIDLKNPRKK